MSIDWSSNDFRFLNSKLQRGEVTLFLGAGFSFDCQNRLGERPPLANDLARSLAELSGFTFANEPLPKVYGVAETNMGSNALWRQLEESFQIQEFDDWYNILSKITWRRIYTLNIDDLVEEVYRNDSNQKLCPIVKGDPPIERDMLFDDLQCIHLHGWIKNRAAGLSFTVPDFAQHTATIDPWYSNLVDDLHNYPIIFIGTEAEEQQLYHYTELREARTTNKAGRETRPKSFLVNPGITDLTIASLKDRNIVPIKETGETFFRSIESNIGLGKLSKLAVREAVYPNTFIDGKSAKRAIVDYFDLILPESTIPNRRKEVNAFFYGAEPTWTDVFENRDGCRNIGTSVLEDLIKPFPKFKCVAIHGPAGSGKTTTMMRVALELAKAGEQVFFAQPHDKLNMTGILEHANKRQKRVYIFIDNIGRKMASINAWRKQLISSLNVCLIVAERTNKYTRNCGELDDFGAQVTRMPDLSNDDIVAIIGKLEEFSCLGVLKSKSQAERIEAFMEKANKQLLVAMREATTGKDFDLILRNEFEELEPVAKLAYTICCIAVARGAGGVYRKHLTPCLPTSNFVKGIVLDDLLRGVLVEGNPSGSLLRPRHRLIAQWVSDDIAPLALKQEAVLSLLRQLSTSVQHTTSRRKNTPPYVAYRGLINSRGLNELLGNNEMALDIYRDVTKEYENDALFWLHYGISELNAGNLDRSENHIQQSLALYPGNNHATHHLGILYMRKAIDSGNSMQSKQLADKGIEILKNQCKEDDTHAFHSYIKYVLRWYQASHNIATDGEWEELREFGRIANSRFSLDDKIRDIYKDLENEYLKRKYKNRK